MGLHWRWEIAMPFCFYLLSNSFYVLGQLNFQWEREFLIQCSTLSNGGKETETQAQIILLIELKSVIFMGQISID